MHRIRKILVQIGGRHYLRTDNGQYRGRLRRLYRLDSRFNRDEDRSFAKFLQIYSFYNTTSAFRKAKGNSKHKYRNTKQYQNTNDQNSKSFEPLSL